MFSKDHPLPRFIAASASTNLGDGIAVVAWAWVATLLTRDPLLVALIPIALRLPWAIFAIPAGIITDRVSRKALILSADTLRAVAFVGATIAIHLATPLPPAPDAGVADAGLFIALGLCALLIGAAEVFRDNAAQTVLPSLVRSDKLESANGQLWSAELTANALAGPAVGAFLIAEALMLPFAFNVLAYGLAVILVSGLNLKARDPNRVQRDWKREFRQGLDFLIQRPMLRMLAVLTGLWNMCHQMVVMALVLHVQENLNAGPRTYGLILAMGAVGGVAGGLLGGPAAARFGRGVTAQWALLLSSLCFALIPLMPGAISLTVLMAAFALFGVTWDSVSVAFRQRMIPDAILGRVTSLYRLTTWGMMPVGLALSGLLVRMGEPVIGRPLALQLPFIVAGAGTLLLTAFAWSRIGRGFTEPDSCTNDCLRA
ncbi:MFS transporter [Pseudooceanicola nanhaiensis]|uniref:MFS transporter n=1 Tax=Pseudooceanicola nanhaiensis TaxID=375761 RepID=UPI001CD7216D|nr:MFS transporter [Pseudooceanicola nanhaiensis]MCA0921428.1 MFS transporter [Pseudooceanicola nanhaiensis]